MTAQVGAFMVFSRLPSLRCGMSRSLAALDFTKMTRAGRPLLAVGPIFMKSTSSFSTASGTSRGNQALCVRAPRNSCCSALSSNRIVCSLNCQSHFIAKTPLVAGRGCRYRVTQRLSSYRPHLLHVRAEVLEQVLDAVAQRGGRARAARAGAAHVQEHDAVFEAMEDDVAAVVGYCR